MGAVCRQVQDETDHLVTTETHARRFYGWRVVYAPDARAWTEAPATLGPPEPQPTVFG